MRLAPHVALAALLTSCFFEGPNGSSDSAEVYDTSTGPTAGTATGTGTGNDTVIIMMVYTTIPVV